MARTEEGTVKGVLTDRSTKDVTAKADITARMDVVMAAAVKAGRNHRSPANIFSGHCSTMKAVCARKLWPGIFTSGHRQCQNTSTVLRMTGM